MPDFGEGGVDKTIHMVGGPFQTSGLDRQGDGDITRSKGTPIPHIHSCRRYRIAIRESYSAFSP